MIIHYRIDVPNASSVSLPNSFVRLEHIITRMLTYNSIVYREY